MSAYCEIPLRARDGSVRAVARVDADCFDAVGQHRWCLTTTGYAQRRLPKSEGGDVLYLHRFLLGLRPGDGWQADHINGDRLDCRMANLRVCSHAENQRNRAASGHKNGSGYRGVHWHTQSGKWTAMVRVAGHRHYLGLYGSAEGAAGVAAQFRAEHGIPSYGVDA